MPYARSPQTQSTRLIPKTAAFDEFLEHRQLQLFLVRADGMQVDADKCRLIRSYLWFEVVTGRYIYPAGRDGQEIG